MAAIRGVLLDFYGTVVHDDDVIVADVMGRVTASVAGRPGAPTSDDVGTYWWKRFVSACDAAHGTTFRTQRELEHESLEQTLAWAGSDLDAAELSELMFGFWRAPDLFADASAFLARLDVPVCLVSDIDRDDVEAAIAHHSLRLDHIVTSEDSRAYKPRPESFERALATLGLGADEVVHVGNSWSSDVVGAAAMGIRAVWVNRTGRAQPSGVSAPWRTVARLDEV